MASEAKSDESEVEMQVAKKDVHFSGSMLKYAFDPPISKRLGGPVVQLRSVFKSYTLEGGVQVSALRDVELSVSSAFYPIRRGEFVMIRGPSGGGKTTLLNLIGTIDRATGGEVELFGQSLDNSATDAYLAKLRLESIGFVFQTFNLLATLSAFENVELPMNILEKLNAKERRERAKQLLTAVGLEDRMQHLPSELSGGEQQRVTIARALSNDPKLLLLDEPTGDLDTKNTVDIMNLLLEINQTRGITCIMVTHNPDLECYADRVLYVEDGTFKEQAINTTQTRINYEKYLAYLNELEQ